MNRCIHSWAVVLITRKEPLTLSITLPQKIFKLCRKIRKLSTKFNILQVYTFFGRNHWHITCFMYFFYKKKINQYFDLRKYANHLELFYPLYTKLVTAPVDKPRSTDHRDKIDQNNPNVVIYIHIGHASLQAPFQPFFELEYTLCILSPIRHVAMCEPIDTTRKAYRRNPMGARCDCWRSHIAKATSKPLGPLFTHVHTSLP